jgi:PadR family transcriptional regulator, regulatory protein AphA
MSPMVRQPLRIEHALLGFLREPMHAYEIHQRLVQTKALGLVWRMKQAQLYAQLGRLEQAGYIVSTTEPQGTRPPRKVLGLTVSGEAAFARWLVTPVEHGRDFRMEFLAKLFFARQEGAEAVATLLEAQRAVCQGWLDGLHARSNDVRGEEPYDWLVLQFRVGQVEAMLRWLDVCEGKV